MQRRFHTLVVLSLTLLAIVGMVNASVSRLASPARAQEVTSLLTPPSFENQRGVIGIHPIPDPTQDGPPTFAISDVPDPTAFPTTAVRVVNFEGVNDDQRFWLSVRIRQQDPDVRVDPLPGYAQMGLIAPGGTAEYTATFPVGTSAQVEFEVDGSTDEAVMLTLLQFALEAGFTAAELTGLGGHDADIGLALAEVVAEQYLADLPTLTPCANAVAAVQRGLMDQEQFTRDMQGCLESPIWQASVDQVLTRVADRDWFQQSVNAAGLMLPAVGLAVRTVKATQFATTAWGMYQKFHPEVPGAMVGTVAFVSMDTSSRETLEAATAVPELSVYEVVGRAQAAVQQAGTYRYESIVMDESDEQIYAGNGEIVIGGGRRMQDSDDGLWTNVDETGRFFYEQEDGSWNSGFPPHSSPDVLTQFLGTPVPDWSLLGSEEIDDQSAYVIERIGEYLIGGGEYRETYWIDTGTFLPLRQRHENQETLGRSEIVFSDFGTPVDVQVPQEALAPTPTPTPPEPANPLTSNDPVAIAEGFLQSLFAQDFERARQYYAPDRQPDDWLFVFHPSCLGVFWEDCERLWGGPFKSVDLIAGCSGVDYTTVERDEVVTFTFSTPCALAFEEYEGLDLKSYDQIIVEMEQANGQWYVYNARVLW